MLLNMNPRTQQIISLWLIPLIVVGVMTGWLYYWLQNTQEFTYFYREQQQIFLFDASYIHSLVMQVGGVGVLIAQFFSQFFVLPQMGALITTLISLVTGFFFWLTLRKLNESPAWMPLAFLPAALYNIYLSDNYAHYDGLIALAVFALLLWLYTVACKLPAAFRAAVGVILTIVLFFGFGSIATLFALAVLLFDMLKGSSKRWPSVCPLIAVLAVGMLANSQGWVVTPAYAFWMKGYVEYFFEPDMLYSYAWLSALLTMVLVWVASKVQLPAIGQILILVILLGGIPFGTSALAASHKDENMYNIQKVTYYANQENWDKVIEVSRSQTGNYIFLNYLNLAYAKKGELMERLLTIPQQGSQSLILNYQQYTDISILMARVYYHIGVIGLSQFHAFSSNMSVTYGNPAMTQMMIRNYLINGQYQIAEKQLRKLEKTWYYADWARQQRKYLSDEAVMADPELSFKRKDLPEGDDFAMLLGPLNDTKTIIDTNPEETGAVEYAIGMMLLDKNFATVKDFVETKYGIVKIWPECLQEAIVAYSEQDMDYCRQYGVSEEIIARWAQFRQETLQLRHNGGNPSQLSSKWGKTFWYYMLKTNKK